MYPEPTNGLKLKRTLLSYLDGAIGSVERPLEEQLLVTEMLLSRSFAFGPEIVRPRERASALARADAGRAIELGSRLPSFGVASDDFLFGLADALRPQDVFQSAVSDAMIAHLVRINPFLAVSPLAWATSAERRRELVQSLKASPRIDATLIVSIIKASLDGGADLSVTQDLGDSAGESTVHAFMEWLSATNRPDALQVLSRSRQVLIGRGRAILKWLAVHRDAPIAAFVAASVVLEPSVHVEELGEEFWSNSTRFPILDMERNDALRAASFVLRKALETSSVGAVDGVVASFSVVYEAVALSELPEQVWSMLSAVLPGSWWDWDRCDRMVRGVVRKFARSNWPVQKFIRTFESRKLLERALRFAKWDWESSGYFNEVCQTFRRGMLDVSEAQARALRSLC